MFDISAVEAEAQKEIAEEQAKVAKGKIKAKLSAIASAEQILANLRAEYQILLRDIGSSKV